MTLLLVAPAVDASSPATSHFSSAFSTDGQTIEDLALDPTGEFAVAVVAVDPSKAVVLPGQPMHHDIFPCDFGGPTATTGPGCRSIDNEFVVDNTAAQTAGGHLDQAAAYTSYFDGGTQGRYAIAGPGNSVSFWSNSQDTRLARNTTTSTNGWANNVTVSPDGERVVAAFTTVPSSGSTAGQGLLVVYDTTTDTSKLTYDWGYALNDAAPTALAYSLTTELVVAGTAKGAEGQILFLHPRGSAPTATSPPPAIETSGPVREVQISRTADAVVAATGRGVYFALVNTSSGAPKLPGFSRDLDPSFGASAIALTRDGSRFAAASGSTIHFYRNLNSSFVAEEVGTAFQTPDGAAVSDIAYDGTGKLLVAVAGSRVYGFAPSSNAPVWSFDATDPSKGGLDAPLRKVAVSQGAERIVVAGRSTLMPYRTLVSATAAFDQPSGTQVQPGTTVALSFRVTNTGSIADNYTFVADIAPIGWNVRGPDSVEVAPDQTRTLNVSVDVPGGTTPGFYGIRYQVRSRLLFDQGASQTSLAGPGINLTIPRSVVLNVTTADDRLPPLHVGGVVTEPVILRNDGNAEAVVNLSASQLVSRGAEWPIRFDKDKEIHVAPGASVTVNMMVTAPSDAASGDRDSITITAREGRPGVDPVISEATKMVTVYVDPKFGSELSSTNSSFEFLPSEPRQIAIAIQNTGNTEDTFNVSFAIAPASYQNDWRVSLDHDHVTIPRGERRTILLTVRPGVTNPREATLVLKAASNGSMETETSTISLSLAGKLPTTTPPHSSFLPGAAPMLSIGLVGVAALLLRRRRANGGRP